MLIEDIQKHFLPIPERSEFLFRNFYLTNLIKANLHSTKVKF